MRFQSKILYNLHPKVKSAFTKTTPGLKHELVWQSYKDASVIIFTIKLQDLGSKLLDNCERKGSKLEQ
jgi:hypothetical protein